MPRRAKKRAATPSSSTWPRGLSSAACGRQLAPELDQLVLVAAGAVQQQQRGRAAAGLVAMDESVDGAHCVSDAMPGCPGAA